MLFRRPRRPALPEQQWERALHDHPELAHWGAPRRAALRDRVTDFLASKRFSGAGGLLVDDAVGLSIALQACLPVLQLGLDWYDDFDGVIVYPDQFLVDRSMTDDDGIVHESRQALAGETIPGGPVVISWADASPGPRREGWNVVIHEFVHKLDMRDGIADGVPPLPASRRRSWQAALDHAYADFCDRLDAIERSLPRHIDPESEAADPWYAKLPLDPYAAEDPAEFFAVAGEAFFVDSSGLRQDYPAFHRELLTFFGYDPEQPD